ncbi:MULTISPECIES: S8 family serine peptidase [unclassified Streptomyces]|uniref:S8 family serine peptidase n=1 Tax=unclassified Streptomyces TaxID=2593676 RepID=UPI003369C908
MHDSEWALTALQAKKAWKISKGAGVTVAVIGTGVDASHPDLRGRVLAGKDFGDGPSGTGTRDQGVAMEQATHAAGIIVGTGRNYRGNGLLGLAPQARVLPLGVYEDRKPMVDATARAIRHAVSRGAKVIDVAVSFKKPSAALRSAVTYALSEDTVVVAGAGDNGKDGNRPTYPAAYRGVVSVVATDEKGAVWTDSHHGGAVTLAAPGVSILTTAPNSDYWTGAGTAYAAPWVAAGAALLRSEHPRWTAGQVVQKLIDTADRKGSSGRDPRYGFGLIAPAKALADRAAPPASTSPPGSGRATAEPDHKHSAARSDEGSALVAIGAVAGALVVLAVIAVFLISRRKPPNNSHS